MIYEIHKKLTEEEVKRVNTTHEAIECSGEYREYLHITGLWYPVVYGIEDMRDAVRALSKLSFEHPSITFRIVQIHYRTREVTE